MFITFRVFIIKRSNSAKIEALEIIYLNKIYVSYHKINITNKNYLIYNIYKMSKNKFHTIEISIPKHMLDLTKSGKVSLVPSLTKTGNISKRNGKQSFVVVASADNKPHIINDGYETIHDELFSKRKVKLLRNNTHDKLIEDTQKQQGLKISKLKRTDILNDNDELIKTINSMKPIKIKPPEIITKAEIVEEVNKVIKEESISNSNKVLIDNVLLDINDTMKLMSSNRKENRVKNGDKLEKIFNAIIAYDFYPTPLQYGQYMYNEIISNFNNLKDVHVLDVCSGLLSLSLPFIENMVDTTNISLVDSNPSFCDIIKPLSTLKNIQIKESDFFDLSPKLFYNTNVDVILCNPPFAFPIDGKRYETGYLFFFKKILDIMIHQKRGHQSQCFFICPVRYFAKNKKLSKGEIIDPSSIIPESTEKIINKLIHIDWLLDDGSFNGQIQYVDEVSGFKTIKKGVPSTLGISAGLFRIINFS